MADPRVYKVKIVGQPLARLVRADNRSQALNYVARASIKVDLATQTDLIEMLGKGVPVEQPDLNIKDQ